MINAVIGTGIVGTKIAEVLLQKNETVIVYNRTIEKTVHLGSLGARVGTDIADVLGQAECIILTLSNKKAIDDTLFARQYSFKNKMIIQMGTISPEESIEIYEKVRNSGGDYLECPILGSRREIEQKNLITMVGGDPTLFKKWQTFFSFFGPDCYYIGKVGQATALKLAINQIIASHVAGFSLSLGMVEQNQISTDLFMEILKKSSLYAPMFEKKMPNWQRQNYSDPNFSVKNLLKDVRLIADHADGKGLNTAIIRSIEAVLETSVEEGFEHLDYSSVYHTINRNKQ
ncbi:MAG: NAD(P)-dependent oxidoreductase [Candidatus Omnitrophica bacterium]|nr:NAD(P)-dependent oxidoreductase [Candidatus Omnitrophota bacterium]